MPPVDPGIVVSAGNAALEGAKMAILSFREQLVGVGLRAQIEYVELSGRQDFNDAFFDSLEFPHLDSVAS